MQLQALLGHKAVVQALKICTGQALQNIQMHRLPCHCTPTHLLIDHICQCQRHLLACQMPMWQAAAGKCCLPVPPPAPARLVCGAVWCWCCRWSCRGACHSWDNGLRIPLQAQVAGKGLPAQPRREAHETGEQGVQCKGATCSAKVQAADRMTEWAVWEVAACGTGPTLLQL